MSNKSESAIFINGKKLQMSYPQFNGGERNVRIPSDYVNKTGFKIHDSEVYALIFDSNAAMDLLLVCDALRRMGSSISTLTIPYFPYARQDRVCNVGESHSLKVFCSLVNSIGAKEVVVYDAHSSVVEALLDNPVIVSQEELVSLILSSNDDYENMTTSSENLPVEFLKYTRDVVVISPDGGAIKKAASVAKSCVNGRLEIAGKIRDVVEGQITGVFFNPSNSIDGKNCLIPDDIADKGMSFFYLSKKIKDSHSPENLGLLVSHGLFVDGCDKLYETLDDIFCFDYTDPNKLKIVRLEGV